MCLISFLISGVEITATERHCFHEEGKRGKGKGERGEEIGRGLQPLPIKDLLEGGDFKPV
jgi:hypothetical protein